MPEITTTATTDSARIVAGESNVVYVREQTSSTASSYVVTPHAPTPSSERPTRR